MSTPTTAEIVMGVKISCDGDIKTLGAAKYVSLEVPSEKYLGFAEISPMSERIGMPVLVQQYAPHPAWKNSQESGVSDNQEVTSLFSDLHPDNFPLAPMRWQSKINSVYILRSDRKDLSVQQAEALCYYCQFHLADSLQEASESGKESEKVKAAAAVNPDNFRAFFAEFKAKKMAEDSSWQSAVSPI
ncbi:hypothetical protein P7C71_g2814, partial [Lecanoromycetidae sp. Uapishka_2]